MFCLKEKTQASTSPVHPITSSNINPLQAYYNTITEYPPKQNWGRVYSEPGAQFVSADCNKEKARIMNHLSGSVPLNRERGCSSTNEKHLLREGRHVRWASVAALEFFCRDHMTRKTIMLVPEERATC